MTSKKPTVLIVDDESVVRDLLYEELGDRGYVCSTAVDGSDALAKLTAHGFDVVLLDIRLPGMSGMELLSTIRSAHFDTVAVMITAVNDVHTAVEAMKLGASDYIVKPFDLDKVDASIRALSSVTKHLAERRGCKTPLYVGGEEEAKQGVEKSSGRLNAIARGVEARWELLTGHSKIVTQTTIDIARRLGIPDKEIQRWAAVRARLDAERKATITSSLIKLERSPLAQIMLGLLPRYPCTPKANQSRN